MAKVYYDLIKKELWTFDKVLPRWQAEVQALLDADKTDKE